ncbi:transforming acidic coiled-coil-containing protein 3-like isoform X4 [Mytilus edulis]|uniref:transforming acidic coiled-coil-containing protein 3-like isoform X4 n=1 Tax=Mytilus edulis TaxID=6550 RepID=UPI0039F0721B
MCSSLAQTPVVKNSILKPFTKDNLIQLSTPVHKNLKVKFQTPQTAHKVTPTRYEQIKELDDQENWAERTTVVLKCDHEENTKNAQAILHDLIYQVLDSKEESQVTPVTGPSLPMVSEETQDTGDDCKEKADNLSSQGHENVQQVEKETPSSPIIPAKSGAYSVDFDNLDTIDPFKNKGGLSSSPSSQKIEKIASEDNQAESDSEKLLEDIELPDIKLEDIADVTLSEYVLCEEGDTTVIENKHSGEGDLTVDESKQTEDKDLTVIENKCKNEVDDISPKIEENKQLHDIDLENIKDPFATTKQLANSPQVNTTSGTSESTLVKENPFAALKSDIGLVESDGDSNFLYSPLKLPADSLVSEPNIINSPMLKSTENQPSIDEEMNPFATKTKVANSPAVSGDPFAPKSTVANSPSLDADPFATKSTVANSPILDRTQDPMATKSKVPNSPKSDGESMNTFDMKAELPKSPAQSSQDPFATKTKVANSPGINSNENPFETKSKVTSSPTIGSEENPFATKSMVPNSPTVISEVDPFATKSNVPNSPAISTEVDPFASKAKVPNSPALKSSEEDPFTTKPKGPNSPAISTEADPFATKTKVPNSPAISTDADPFATKTKVPNSPAISTDADPFATKTKVPNSPALKSSEDDPFAAKPNVSNSPAISAEADPFASKTKVSTSPLKKSDDDPFTTKSMVTNSPAVSSEEDPFATKTKVTNSPVVSSEEDPFATKTKVPNSPVVSSEEDPFTTKTKVPNSPVVSSEEDPFATKTKVPNSPVVSSEEDPFATKTKVPNSPVVSSEEDPFATKTKVPNSPVVKTEEDPFATESKVPNSPLRNSDNDPFTSKSKVPNSPVVNQKENPFASKSKVPNSPTISTEEDPFATNLKVANLPAINSKDDQFATKSKVPISPTTSSEENPFAPKSKIENSPSKNLDDIDPFATKSKVPSSPKNDEVKIQDSLKQAIGADAFLNNNPFSPQCPAVNITSKRGATELSGKQDGGLLNLGLSIDEDQFKPACDVFNDTASWDALESFGSCTSDPSTLNRQSLYVKFDPLVNLPPDDPRRASIDIRRASMKLERLREINLRSQETHAAVIPIVRTTVNSDESFLLFGTPPKSSSVRNVGIVSQGQLDGGAKKKTPAKTPVQELKKSAVDLLSDSPDILSMSINVNRLGEQAEGIKMNLADVQDSDSGIVEVLQYTEADWKKMQHALLMEVQGKILAKEREYALIKKQYEDQMKKIMEEHKTELASRDEKAKKNAKSFDEIMVILAEYEKTIDNLIGEKEKLKEEKDEEIKKLKDKIQQLNTDEQSVETTLSLLHQRYEKLKTVLQGYITNEETLKKYGDECTAKVKATEEKMQALKKDAEAKLQKANTENETLKSEAEAEGSKLKVALKRKEMECQRKENEKQSLQSQIEQKIQENTELTSLCDELLSKVK